MKIYLATGGTSKQRELLLYENKAKQLWSYYDISNSNWPSIKLFNKLIAKIKNNEE